MLTSVKEIVYQRSSGDKTKDPSSDPKVNLSIQITRLFGPINHHICDICKSNYFTYLSFSDWQESRATWKIRVVIDLIEQNSQVKNYQGWIPPRSRFFENSSKTINAMMLKFSDNWDNFILIILEKFLNWFSWKILINTLLIMLKYQTRGNFFKQNALQKDNIWNLNNFWLDYDINLKLETWSQYDKLKLLT